MYEFPKYYIEATSTNQRELYVFSPFQTNRFPLYHAKDAGTHANLRKDTGSLYIYVIVLNIVITLMLVLLIISSELNFLCLDN